MNVWVCHESTNMHFPQSDAKPICHLPNRLLVQPKLVEVVKLGGNEFVGCRALDGEPFISGGRLRTRYAEEA